MSNRVGDSEVRSSTKIPAVTNEGTVVEKFGIDSGRPPVPAETDVVIYVLTSEEIWYGVLSNTLKFRKIISKSLLSSLNVIFLRTVTNILHS